MICDDMIVGAACMAHSAVEGGQVRLILQPERRGVYLFFILFYIFLIFFFFGRVCRDIVATILFSFYTLSSSISIIRTASSA